MFVLICLVNRPPVQVYMSVSTMPMLYLIILSIDILCRPMYLERIEALLYITHTQFENAIWSFHQLRRWYASFYFSVPIFTPSHVQSMCKYKQSIGANEQISYVIQTIVKTLLYRKTGKCVIKDMPCWYAFLYLV